MSDVIRMITDVFVISKFCSLIMRGDLEWVCAYMKTVSERDYIQHLCAINIFLFSFVFYVWMPKVNGVI